jgi:hypothetical protein
LQTGDRLVENNKIKERKLIYIFIKLFLLGAFIWWSPDAARTAIRS